MFKPVAIPAPPVTHVFQGTRRVPYTLDPSFKVYAVQHHETQTYFTYAYTTKAAAVAICAKFNVEGEDNVGLMGNFRKQLPTAVSIATAAEIGRAR